MPTFVTVKQAAQATGRSTSSIRRAIYPILKDDAHPDRGHVEPSVDDALKLRVAGVNFAWRVSEELLARVLPATVPTEKGAAPAKAAPQAQSELLSMLQRELEIKNQQIGEQTEMLRKQMELMTTLSERLREGNILIGSLQQRLGLADGRAPRGGEPPIPARAAERSAKGSPAKRSPVATDKTAKAPVATPPPRGFFARLFRSL